MASTDGTIGADGTIEWRDGEGRLHRVGGPARVFPSGREEWFRHGRLHREDGPAVVHANGSVKYYVDGVRHREGAPACVYVNGTEKWYREGRRHRDEGPAATYPDGRRVWFVEGEKVREERPGGLGEYRRRRDFAATPEPAPRRRRRRPLAPRFVVQEHSARRLHWDLRLEHGGVAASWAIPNGVPDEPSQNRKAVRTEDHPLEYLEFEGEIPKGEYGAGTVRIWDSGTYELEKWEVGKVMVRFEGERVRGRYALFRAGEDERDWMIHRIDPPAERRDPFPESVVPMLAKLAPLPTGDEGWAAEVKWDGVRAVAYCRPGRVELQTRNLNVVTAQYPEVRRLARALGARDAVLDGELVAFDARGRPSFERLQQRIHQTDPNVVRRRMKSHPVTYVLFDLLYLDGRDLTGEPYSRRRELLEALGLEGESWQTPGYSVGRAAALLAASAEQGLEGIVLKRLDSSYAPGKRNGAWLKVKTVGRQELVIGGWVGGAGRRRDRIGAILLGAYDEAGELRYAGKVGTGFSERDLDELLERLRPLARDRNPFAARRGPRDANFVAPRLVAEIEFREMTAEGMVRHGSFKGLREDKPAGEVRLERPDGEAAPAALEPPLAELLAAGRKRARVRVGRRELSLAGLDRVVYPATGFRKGELIEWYAGIAETLLPHLRGRPLGLRRRRGGEPGPFLVEDLPSLVEAANLAAPELPAALARVDAPEHPTAAVFELTAAAPAGALDCVQVALWLRGMFGQLGLRSYPKTAAADGIQLWLPLGGEAAYQRTRPFAKTVAETLEAKFGDRVAAARRGDGRAGRVVVEWRRNERDAALACPYSLLAGERPAVSTPLEWEELEAAVEAGDPRRLACGPTEVRRRLADRGDLFAPLLSERQELPG